MNGAGRVISTTNETFGYDANRMQLISQTATTTNVNDPLYFCIPSCPPPPPGGTNLSLTYRYQASAGQMGVGTTAGNAGQLMSITGTIGGLTESAYYTYDLLGRLGISSQTSNGTSAVRKFAYDRWGNRTTVWDNPFGVNPIQSVTLEQSGGAPTNRITSVTAGSTVNYTYDPAGNVTNDGVHSYNYDSENRLVSVDSGSTAQYSYDHQNRRYKKTIGSTVTHYVWEGSKVLGEYNGSTGALQVNYWYAWTRLFKKTGVTTQVFLSDRLSTRIALSDIGVVLGRQGHLPFGEDFAESGTQEKHHFTSYERDGESATDYAINRYYSPTVGRFMSADQYMATGGLMDPRSWNRYSYTRNVLTNRIDPLGLNDVTPDPCPEPCLNDTPIGHLYGTAPYPTDLGGLEAFGIGGVLHRPRWNPDGKSTGVAGFEVDEPSELNPCETKLFFHSGLLDLIDVRKSRRIAEKWEQKNGGAQDDNWVNAVKHCIWSCEMTQRIGEDEAYEWGLAHECDEKGKPLIDSSNPKIAASSKMDLHNNEVGRRLGRLFPNMDCWDNCRLCPDLQIIP